METTQLRVERAQELLRQLDIEAVVATSQSNFYYFSGIAIEPHERLLAYVIPKVGDPVVVAPKLHEEDLTGLAVDVRLWNDGEDEAAQLASLLPDTGVVSLDNLWVAEKLLALINIKPKLTFVNSNQTLGRLRTIKDKTEIATLMQLGQMTDTIMQALIRELQPGMTEMEVAKRLKVLWDEAGAQGLSFDPIIAAGANGSRPHHQSGQRKLQHGDTVIIDMGGLWHNYCSDITRTVVIGEPSAEILRVYEVVKQAQAAAVAAVRPGVRLGDIDSTARNLIAEAGYGDYFNNRVGHGLGIDIHEPPFVFSANNQLAEAGMVFSVEPGIYLPQRFGIRIEDVVVVTPDGCQSLYDSPRELLQM